MGKLLLMFKKNYRPTWCKMLFSGAQHLHLAMFTVKLERKGAPVWQTQGQLVSCMSWILFDTPPQGVTYAVAAGHQGHLGACRLFQFKCWFNVRHAVTLVKRLGQVVGHIGRKRQFVWQHLFQARLIGACRTVAFVARLVVGQQLAADGAAPLSQHRGWYETWSKRYWRSSAGMKRSPLV